MLSHALRRRTRQHTSIFRLHPHQHFNHTLTPTPEEEVTETDLEANASSFKRTAFIQTWEPFRNLADAFALVRAVEQKYGKVVEAQFIRDYEMNNRYQMFTYVNFLDPNSVKKIPTSGYTFKIPAPVMEDRPGGPGLDDIKHLLESADVVKDFDFDFDFSRVPKARVIGARIIPTNRGYFTVPNLHPYGHNRTLARAFLRWRGFHKPEPFTVMGTVAENAWFGKPAYERMAMTAAMDRCSKTANVPNPARRGPKTDTNDGKVSDSSSASTSMDSPESSSPTTLDIPISHESTSKSTQSHPLPTKSPQSPSQYPPGPTQLPPEPTPPKPTGQLTPEQKKTVQRQMDRAKQLIAKTRKPNSKKPRKSNKESEEKSKDQQLDKSPEEPLEPASKGIVAAFWKMIGR